MSAYNETDRAAAPRRPGPGRGACPPACAVPAGSPPANPFAGAWATAERQQIAFRDDTVVLNLPGEKPTPLGAETCDGRFRFAYGQPEPRQLCWRWCRGSPICAAG